MRCHQLQIHEIHIRANNLGKTAPLKTIQAFVLAEAQTEACSCRWRDRVTVSCT
jgi:hypothetical protein